MKSFHITTFKQQTGSSLSPSQQIFQSATIISEMKIKIINPQSLLLAVCLSLVLLSCKENKEENIIPDDVIPVSIMKPEKGMTNPVVHLSGQFTTEDESNLSFKNGGLIRAIYVKEGDAVQKGQILATLDMTEIETLNSQAQIALSKAERDYQRATNLYHDSVATLEQMQNAKTALEIARQQVANTQYNKQTSVMRATQSGYVLNKFAQAGQIVGPGMPVLRINGAHQDKWVLKAGVSDLQWALLKVGDKAIITADAFPEEEIQGRVLSKSKGTDPMSGTFTISVSLDDKRHNGIAAGLFGKAKVQSSTEQTGWAIPFSALLDSDKNTGYVFVAAENNTAKKIPVSIDRIEQKNVIINSGLENTDNIIVKGSAYLTDGSKIRIVP